MIIPIYNGAPSNVPFRDTNRYFHNENRLLMVTNTTKVECVFPMVTVSILPQAELEPNDHREGVTNFNGSRWFLFWTGLVVLNFSEILSPFETAAFINFRVRRE